MFPTIGEIILTAISFTPRGFAPCNGRYLETSRYRELYQLIGNTYGGNEYNFQLPNMTAPEGTQYCICINGESPSALNGFLGQIKRIAHKVSAPQWDTCEGQVLPVNDYAGLAAILDRKWHNSNISIKLPTFSDKQHGIYTMNTKGGGYDEGSTLGTIGLFPFEQNQRMQNWIPCQGQQLSIPQFQAIFALIGSRFGGDGRSTFALPNLADVDGCCYWICINGAYPSRGDN